MVVDSNSTECAKGFIAQLVERRPEEASVGGSSPSETTKIRDTDKVSVRSPKPRWVGSIPTSRAKK